MKKVLLMVPLLWQGGQEAVCVMTARGLLSKAEVTILIFDDYELYFDVSGLDVVNIDVPSRPGKAAKIANVLKRVRKVRKIKKERHIDVTYSFGESASIVNVLSHAGDRVVVGFHGTSMLENPRTVRLLGKRSDAVISVSKEMAAYLKKHYGFQHVTALPNPFDTAEIERKAGEEISDFPFPGNPHTIITVGREDVQKGYWHLLKAFSLLVRKVPDARLVVLGSGAFEREKQLARDLGIQNFTAFPGARKNPYAYEKRSALYVLSSNHEGFPGALVEAMAVGLPVIGTDCRTGPREILLDEKKQEEVFSAFPETSIRERVDGAFGILMPDLPEEPDYEAGHILDGERDLARAMAEILSDPEKAKKLGEAARSRAAVYSKEAYTGRLARILDL